MNYLASPPLVVAYALAGTMDIDLTTDPLGHDADGKAGLPGRPVAQRAEVSETIRASLTSDMFRTRYGAVFDGRRVLAAGAGGRRARPSPGRTTPPTC
jgi:aconitate hydratase